jgi:phage gp29-like protein
MALVDAYGRPVRTQQLVREHAAPSLTGVRTLWNETVAGGLTPVRLASILQQAADGDHNAQLTLSEEMEERDLHYSCELSKRKLAVSRLPISVEAYSDSARDVELADAVRDLVRKPGFRALIKDLLDALGKGYSVCEIRWDRTGARWIPRGYTWRDPRFFCFDQVSRSEIRLRDEADMIEGIPLEPFNFIVHVPRIKTGLPIRGGLARLAAWAYMCKGYAIKDWLAFAEVFGMPLRLGKYDSTASEGDKAVLRMAVANLGIDAAAIFPKSMEIELVEAGKGASADFFQLLADYLDAQVSRGILGQTATTQGTPGKLGNEEAQAEVRRDIRDDDAEQMEETLGRDLVRAYIDLNYGPQENYPSLQLRADVPEDVAALSSALEKLVPLGLRVEASVVRDKLGLPDPGPNVKPEDLLGAPMLPAPPSPAALNHAAGCPSCGVAHNRQGEEASDAIDDQVAEELADWQLLMAPVVDPLAALIDDALAKGQTLAELRERLAELLDTQDPSLLIDALAGAMLKARALGDSQEAAP